MPTQALRDQLDSSGLQPDAALGALQGLAVQAAAGYRSVGTMVYEVLRDAILSGVFSQGQKLRQETLAEAIGVSRVPVRSALIQLEADGLVELQDRKGAVVKSLSEADLAEIYELRVLLEVYALERSMRTMTPQRVANLQRLADEADREAEGASFIRARESFYAELYGASENPVAWGLIEELRLKVGLYMLGWRIGGDHAHLHRELADIAASGDVAAATDSVRRHLLHVRDGVLNKVRRAAA